MERGSEQWSDTNDQPPTTASPEDAAPEIAFGKFELLEPIGRGGAMGIVYKARQQNPERFVALKRIKAGRRAAEDQTQRFLIEFEAMANFNHPNIVPVYEFGEHEGELFYSMAYIEGQNLQDRIANRPMAIDEAVEILRQVSDAIAYAHQHGVIHRDLKPANVIVDSSDKPVVVDFGLAKRVDHKGTPTETGAWIGTPGYMPPEQAREAKTVDERADIYSLGALLYGLLTGRPPFQAATLLDTMLQLTEFAPAPPSQLNHQIDKDLEAICLKCLEKEPAARYATADALQEDLTRYLNHETPRVRPAGPLIEAYRWCRRNQAVATLMLLITLVLIGWSAHATWQNAELRQTNRELKRANATAEREQKKAEMATAIAEREQQKAKREAAKAVAALAIRDSTNRELQQANETVKKGQAGALAATLNAERNLYLLLLGAAHEEIRNARLQVAHQILDGVSRQLPNSWPGIMGWEYHYLQRRCQPHRLELYRHDHPLRCLDVLSGGNEVLLGDADGNLVLLELDKSKTPWEARPRRMQKAHAAAINDVAWAPAGDSFASAGADGDVILWDSDTLNKQRTFEIAVGRATSIDFNNNGDQLVASTDQANVYVWDVASGTELEARVLPDRAPGADVDTQIHDLIVTPNGKRIVTASENHAVDVWGIANGVRDFSYGGHAAPVFAVVALNQSEALRFASAGATGAIKIWEAAEQPTIATLQGHQHSVLALNASSDGNLLVSGGEDGVVRTWSAIGDEHQLLGILTGHAGPVRAVELLDNQVISISDDKSCKVWDIRRDSHFRTLPRRHNGQVNALAFSTDGNRFASAGSDGRINIWRTDSDEPQTIAAHANPVTAIAFDPRDQHKLLFATRNVGANRTGGDVIYRDLRGAAEEDRVALFENYAVAIRFDQTGGNSAIVDQAGMVHVRSPTVTSGKLPTPEPIRDVAFTSDGELAVLTGNNDLQFWDAESFTRLDRPPLSLAVAFAEGQKLGLSSDGGRVLAGKHNGEFETWIPGAATAAFALDAHDAPLACFALSPDQRRLLTADERGNIKLWVTD